MKKFYYKFSPFKAMKKLESRIITEDDKSVKELLRIIDKSSNPIDLLKFKIGYSNLKATFSTDNLKFSP